MKGNPPNLLTLTMFSQPHHAKQRIGVVNTASIAEALHFMMPQVILAHAPKQVVNETKTVSALPFKMIVCMGGNPQVWIIHRDEMECYTNPPTCIHEAYANIAGYYGLTGHELGAVYSNDNEPENSCFVKRVKKVGYESLKTEKVLTPPHKSLRTGLTLTETTIIENFHTLKQPEEKGYIPHYRNLFFWDTIANHKLWSPSELYLGSQQDATSNLHNLNQITFHHPLANSNITAQLKNGVPHSTHQPAILYADGSREEWWYEGKLHRSGGEPAVTTTRPTGLTVHEWWEWGKRHRTKNLPAVLCENLNLPWDSHISHPANQNMNPMSEDEQVRYEEFWEEGIRHNLKGAAFRLGNFQQSHWHGGTLVKTNEQLHAAQHSSDQGELSKLTETKDPHLLHALKSNPHIAVEDLVYISLKMV